MHIRVSSVPLGIHRNVTKLFVFDFWITSARQHGGSVQPFTCVGVLKGVIVLVCISDDRDNKITVKLGYS